MPFTQSPSVWHTAYNLTKKLTRCWSSLSQCSTGLKGKRLLYFIGHHFMGVSLSKAKLTKTDIPSSSWWSLETKMSCKNIKYINKTACCKSLLPLYELFISSFAAEIFVSPPSSKSQLTVGGTSFTQLCSGEAAVLNWWPELRETFSLVCEMREESITEVYCSSCSWHCTPAMSVFANVIEKHFVVSLWATPCLQPFMLKYSSLY